MGLFSGLFGDRRDRSALVPLYQAVVAEARRPEYYARALVPDTMDGRFDMVAMVLTFVLLRLEDEGEATRLPSVLLTEVFIDDMDGTMREVGFGDLVVGKRVGGIMGALGGRLGAYREAGEDAEKRRAALNRNVYRDAPPDDDAVDVLVMLTGQLQDRLAAKSAADLLAGQLA